MVSLPDERRSEIESLLAEWLSDHRIPGAALAVVDGDELAYSEGFGARNLEENAPATPETLFGVGSCTKSFTAAAIMQLVERGELDVGDATDQYVLDLAGVPGEPITIRELLTHTSGMPSDGSAGPLITRPLGMGHIEVPLSSGADFRRHVEGSLGRRVTDREAFFYYNSGYTVLGEIVAEVSGRSYAEYVSEHVLDPLGMDRSTFSREAFRAEEDRMTPYVKQEGDSTESGFPFDPLIHAPGGLVSSVSEMANYLRMYVGNGSFGGETVLSPESVGEMTTPVSTYGRYFDGGEKAYGYGLMVEEFLGDRLIGHGGSIAVSNAWFGYLEEAGLGVALACTTGPETHPMVVGPAVLAILRGADPEEVVPHYRLVSALERASGEYGDYRGIGRTTVERVEDDLLVCSTTMGSGIEREARFEFGDGGTDLFFERARLSKSE